MKKLFGFGVGIALFGITTLLAIPSMIRASGADAWAAIATGQAIGAVGSVIISYGSIVAGPAAIARASAIDRRLEYLESLRLRLVIFIPITAICSGISIIAVPHDAGLSALGCMTTCAIGLTASWYFVGTGQPYVLLLMETTPRVLGTILGIFMMQRGASAAAGLNCQGGGLALGVALCSWYIIRGRNKSGGSREQRSIMTILFEQRHGVTSSAVSALYNAVPIIIIGAVAPLALPAYAVLYKLQRQIATAMSPLVQVFQGWVPRARRQQLVTRAKCAMLAVWVAGLLLAIALFALGRPLIGWLGNGQILVPIIPVLLTALSTGLALIESVIGKACLVPLGLIAVVAKVTFWGSLFGLMLIAVLGWKWAVTGALIGLVTGLTIRIALQMLSFARVVKSLMIGQMSVVTTTELRTVIGETDPA